MGATQNTPSGDGGKILVTGSGGQLGKELLGIAHLYPEYEFYFLSREDLSIVDAEAVRHYFNAFHPDYCINCAAYTAVDRAEEEKDLAFRINAEAVGLLAATCKANQCKFIHISTDYVFDGNAREPYKEASATNPQNVYGASKLEGEKQALQFNPEAVIIRTSWLYSEYGKNFVKTMAKLLEGNKEIAVVNDQLGSPTCAGDLAEAILQIISSGRWVPGIYHFSNEGIISWYEFALAVREQVGTHATIRPVSTSEYPTRSKRPAYSALDMNKIQKTYGVVPKNWKQSLARVFRRLQGH